MRPDQPVSDAVRSVARAIAGHATLTPAGGVDPVVVIPTTREIGDQLGYTRQWIDVQIRALIDAGAITNYPALPGARPRRGQPKRRRITIDPTHEAWDGLVPGDHEDAPFLQVTGAVQ